MKKIRITMFNEFNLIYEDTMIAFDKVATRQMCSLLQLLVYHKNGISKEQLIDELWQDTANPANSLKYSIFRLRATLDEIECFKDMNLISTIKNGYQFALDFEISADYIDIDEHYKVLMNANSTKGAIATSAEQIIKLYKGAFFMNDSTNWCMEIRAYYRSIYEKAFTLVCENYIDNKQERDLLPLIQKAIKMDEFFDDAYVYYLRVLISLGEYNNAMNLYKHIHSLYERELGHTPSMNIKSMYRVITSREEDLIDVESLKEKLKMDVQLSNALYCDYETFKHIYHTTLGNARRDNKVVFLLIFQIKSEVDDKKQHSFMAKLKSIMCQHLRSGDVLSKINRVQMIALLPCENIENGYAIIQRITTEFYKKVHKNNARLLYFIRPITDFNNNITEK